MPRDVGPNTVITNAPTDPPQLVAIPNDSRYDYSEFKRTRINFSGTVQFRPIETLTITADALYAQNKSKEERAEQTNWFNRPFDNVTFDDDDVVATAIYLDEGTGYSTKDIGFEQVYRATKTKVHSYGLNANWEIVAGLTLNLDGNHVEVQDRRRMLRTEPARRSLAWAHRSSMATPSTTAGTFRCRIGRSTTAVWELTGLPERRRSRQ